LHSARPSSAAAASTVTRHGSPAVIESMPRRIISGSVAPNAAFRTSAPRPSSNCQAMTIEVGPEKP
jgi:hypothetical protein